jgi:HK97 family phage portal protein
MSKSLFGWFRKSASETEIEVKSSEAGALVSTVSSPESWFLELFDAMPASSGVAVSPSSAMRVPAVRRAVESIAEGVSGLPCVVYETAGAATKPIADHPLVDLLGGNANDWTPAASFFEQTTRDALLHGNAFAWITRTGDGSPVELIRLAPGDVSVASDTDALNPPIYRLAGHVVDRNSLLHLRAPSLDGVVGQSPVTACREAIGILMAIEGHVARLFGNGARPSGVLAFADTLTAEATVKAKAIWQAAHGGGRSGGTAVLDRAATYSPISLSSVDAQLLEVWQHAVDEIARVFGVPPHLLFDLGRATWGNAGEMGASFLRFGLSRWLRAWEGELNLKLVAPEDRRRLSIEFDPDALTRTDLAARADAYQKLVAARVMTPNEARAREGLPPKDGGDELVNPFTTTSTVTSNVKAPTSAS